VQETVFLLISLVISLQLQVQVYLQLADTEHLLQMQMDHTLDGLLLNLVVMLDLLVEVLFISE